MGRAVPGPYNQSRTLMRLCTLFAFVTIAAPAVAQTSERATVDKRTEAVLPKVVAWRRDIHQHPELSNQEVRTAKLVADHLRSLGIEVRTGIAKNGVVGVLRGAKPG